MCEDDSIDESNGGDIFYGFTNNYIRLNDVRKYESVKVVMMPPRHGSVYALQGCAHHSKIDSHENILKCSHFI